MTHFLERWRVLEVELEGGGRRVDVCDAAGVMVCWLPRNLGDAAPEYARRIVGCVNALRGLETERIERMFTHNPPDWWLPVCEGVDPWGNVETVEGEGEAAGQPERVIEYDAAPKPPDAVPTRREFMRAKGWAVNEERTSLGLTQVDLAEALGVDESEVSRWERGERMMSLYDWAGVDRVFAIQRRRLAARQRMLLPFGGGSHDGDWG